MIILLLTALGLAIGVARAYKHKSDKAVFYERLLLPVIFVAIGIGLNPKQRCQPGFLSAQTFNNRK